MTKDVGHGWMTKIIVLKNCIPNIDLNIEKMWSCDTYQNSSCQNMYAKSDLLWKKFLPFPSILTSSGLNPSLNKGNGT